MFDRGSRAAGGRTVRRQGLRIATDRDGTRRVRHPSGVVTIHTVADQRRRRAELLADLDAARDALAAFDTDHTHLHARED